MRVITTEQHQAGLWYNIKNLFKNSNDKKYVLDEYQKRPWAWNFYGRVDGRWLRAETDYDIKYVTRQLADKVRLEPKVSGNNVLIPDLATCFSYEHPGAIYFDRLQIPKKFPTIKCRGIWKNSDGGYIKGLFNADAGKTYTDIFLLLDYDPIEKLDDLIEFNKPKEKFSFVGEGEQLQLYFPPFKNDEEQREEDRNAYNTLLAIKQLIGKERFYRVLEKEGLKKEEGQPQ